MGSRRSNPEPAEEKSSHRGNPGNSGGKNFHKNTPSRPDISHRPLEHPRSQFTPPYLYSTGWALWGIYLIGT